MPQSPILYRTSPGIITVSVNLILRIHQAMLGLHIIMTSYHVICHVMLHCVCLAPLASCPTSPHRYDELCMLPHYTTGNMGVNVLRCVIAIVPHNIY